MSPRRVAAVAALLVAAHALLLCWHLNEPWLFGHTGWAGARRGLSARNFLKWGYAPTGFGMVENVGPTLPETPSRYWHHPSGFSLLLSLSYRLFGVTPWATRLPAVLFALAALAVFLALARRVAGERAALIAGLLCALAPMSAYYGRFPNWESAGLFFGLLTVWAAARWRSEGGVLPAVVGLLAPFFGAFTDWPYFFFCLAAALLLFAGALRERRARQFIALAIFSVATLLAAALLFEHLKSQGGSLEGFGKQARFRSHLDEGRVALWGVLKRWDFYLPWFSALLPAGALLLPLTRLHRNPWPSGTGVAAALMLAGVLQPLVFQQGAAVHDYYAYYLTPGLALGCALSLDALATRLSPWGPRVVGATLVIFSLWSVGQVQSMHHIPGDHLDKRWGFERRVVSLAQELSRISDARDRLLIERSIPLRPQFRWYCDRRYETFRSIDALLAQAKRRRYRVAALRMGQHSGRELRKLRERGLLEAFGDYLLWFPRMAPSSRPPRYQQLEEREMSLGWRYAVSQIVPPAEVVSREALGAPLDNTEPPPWALFPPGLNVDAETAVEIVSVQLRRRVDGRAEAELWLRRLSAEEPGDVGLVIEAGPRGAEAGPKRFVRPAFSWPATFWEPGRVYRERVVLDLEPGRWFLVASVGPRKLVRARRVNRRALARRGQVFELGTFDVGMAPVPLLLSAAPAEPIVAEPATPP